MRFRRRIICRNQQRDPASGVIVTLNKAFLGAQCFVWRKGDVGQWPSKRLMVFDILVLHRPPAHSAGTKPVSFMALCILNNNDIVRSTERWRRSTSLYKNRPSSHPLCSSGQPHLLTQVDTNLLSSKPHQIFLEQLRCCRVCTLPHSFRYRTSTSALRKLGTPWNFR